MKRRNFIKLSASASVLTLLPTEVFALFNSAGMTTCPNVNAKKIVLIQLSGANDGLNTVVPLNQYDTYATLRPNIKLNNVGENHGILNLDSTLLLENQIGLHPSLTGFKSLYDSGFMRVIQGVGYPLQDKSHFKSTDLWLNGGDGTSENNLLNSGWIGRFLESYYSNFLNAKFPLGIQLGSSDNSLGFHGEIEHGMSININGQNPAGFYSVINGLGGTPPTSIPNSEYGNLVRYIIEKDGETNIYAQSISTAFSSGKNSEAVTYPSTSLANQLKSVARFISGGLETKVYLLKIGGFDTHNIQVATNTTTHLGTHANLLNQISEAIKCFITDLNNQNLGDDVIAVPFSEFGRKAGENGNLGTDHGEIAPMFVFGKSINPGVSGTNINLSEAILANNYQVQTVQYDYRRVFSTILQDCFGASNQTLDTTFYDHTNNIGYANNKVSNLIKLENTVPASCYADSLFPANDFSNSNDIIIYPNPTVENISINSVNNPINVVSVFSMDGKFIISYKNPITSDNYTINAQNLAVGIYTIKVDTNNGTFTKKVIVRR
jgi:uncharacterized protein (DUF1501 family)